MSVENAIANNATATKLNMDAKARVTALQNPILILSVCLSVYTNQPLPLEGVCMFYPVFHSHSKHTHSAPGSTQTKAGSATNHTCARLTPESPRRATVCIRDHRLLPTTGQESKPVQARNLVVFGQASVHFNFRPDLRTILFWMSTGCGIFHEPLGICQCSR